MAIRWNEDLINFAKHSLGTGVSCNQVALDGYEASNLLSNSLPMKGFIADSFVRPPVCLTFTLPCHVDLENVRIKLTVGSQRSTGLEIFTSSSENTNALSLFGESGDFYSVSSCKVDDSSCEEVIFRRRSVVPRSNDVKVAEQVMRHRVNEALSKVRIVRVKIFRTQGSSVPALGRIEIVGRISRTVDFQLSAGVKRKWEQITRPNLDWSTLSRSSNAVPLDNETQTGAIHSDNLFNQVSNPKMPEEFMDGLTLDIMALPIRLPSGNVVDRSTLDRFINNEASWGRPPSDPFTGVSFSAQIKPVLDSALKARIDQFLVLNQDEPNLKHVPRTTGGKRPHALNFNYDSLFHLPPPPPPSSSSATSTSSMPISRISPLQRTGVSATGSKVSKLAGPVRPSNAHSVLASNQGKTLIGKLGAQLRALERRPGQLPKPVNPPLSASTSNLASSSSPLLVASSKQNLCSCGQGSNPEEAFLVYKFPCDHLVCRSCLTGQGSASACYCAICSRFYPRGSVQRFHT